MTNYKRNHILYVTTLLLLFVTLLSVIGITIFVLLQFSGSIVTFTLLQFFPNNAIFVQKNIQNFKKVLLTIVSSK